MTNISINPTLALISTNHCYQPHIIKSTNITTIITATNIHITKINYLLAISSIIINNVKFFITIIQLIIITIIIITIMTSIITTITTSIITAIITNFITSVSTSNIIILIFNFSIITVTIIIIIIITIINITVTSSITLIITLFILSCRFFRSWYHEI